MFEERTIRNRVLRHISAESLRCIECIADELCLTYKNVHTALRGTADRINRQYGRCPRCGRSRLLVRRSEW
jgi:hypothetical protein